MIDLYTNQALKDVTQIRKGLFYGSLKNNQYRIYLCLGFNKAHIDALLEKEKQNLLSSIDSGINSRKKMAYSCLIKAEIDIILFTCLDTKRDKLELIAPLEQLNYLNSRLATFTNYPLYTSDLLKVNFSSLSTQKRAKLYGYLENDERMTIWQVQSKMNGSLDNITFLDYNDALQYIENYIDKLSKVYTLDSTKLTEWFYHMGKYVRQKEKFKVYAYPTENRLSFVAYMGMNKEGKELWLNLNYLNHESYSKYKLNKIYNELRTITGNVNINKIYKGERTVFELPENLYIKKPLYIGPFEQELLNEHNINFD